MSFCLFRNASRHSKSGESWMVVLQVPLPTTPAGASAAPTMVDAESILCGHGAQGGHLAFKHRILEVASKTQPLPFSNALAPHPFHSLLPKTRGNVAIVAHSIVLST